MRNKITITLVDGSGWPKLYGLFNNELKLTLNIINGQKNFLDGLRLYYSDILIVSRWLRSPEEIILEQ